MGKTLSDISLRNHAQDVIYEHLIHNILFPLTRYNFIGISEPSQNEIDDYLITSVHLNPLTFGFAY